MANVIIKDEEKWREELKEYIRMAQNTTKSFEDILNEIIDKKDITPDLFEEKTHLDRRNLTNWKNGTTPPYFWNFTTFCVAFGIDILTAVAMRQALGLTFNFKDKVHCIYYHLITDYSGRSIRDCNKVLYEFKVKPRYWLGGKIDKDKTSVEDIKKELEKEEKNRI